MRNFCSTETIFSSKGHAIPAVGFSTSVVKSCCGSMAELPGSIQHPELGLNQKCQNKLPFDWQDVIQLLFPILYSHPKWNFFYCYFWHAVPEERRHQGSSWNCHFSHETVLVFLTGKSFSWTSGWFGVVFLLMTVPAFALPPIPCFVQAAIGLISFCFF